VSLCVAGALRAATFEERIEALFRPLLGERIALSPDGQRVAYTEQRGAKLTIVIRDLEPPEPRRTVSTEPPPSREAPSATGALPAGAETEANAVPPLRFLRWATNQRLVFAPIERVVPLPPLFDAGGRSQPNPDGPRIVAPILAVDADGQQRGVVIEAAHFQETPEEARRTLADLLRTTRELQATRAGPVRWRMPHLDILGFLPRDREQLIIGTHGAYSMPMQHSVDLRTGDVKEFGGDWPAPPGEAQVFDWHRLKVVGERHDGLQPTVAWRDDELAGAQRALERKFPRRTVELLDWSEGRARILFRVTGGSDPGRCFVWQQPEDVVLEILVSAPWLGAAKLNETRPFACTASDGAPLTGYLTWPAKRRLEPPPLVVVFPSRFPGGGHTAFDPEAQVLADAGYAVLRLNHRGVAGLRAEDLNLLREAIDRVPIADACTALEALASAAPDRPFDRRRVGVLGRGFGGYLALRALQQEPRTFHAGIAIDPLLDLRAARPAAAEKKGARAPAPGGDAPAFPAALLEHEGTDWKQLSVLENTGQLRPPLLLAAEPGRDAALDAAVAELHRRLEQVGRPPARLALEAGFAARQPGSRAAAYRRMVEFLDEHLGGFAVKIGPAKEVK
jgi:dienelactone hydrolase